MFMYVISTSENDQGPVKLGISADPDQRVRELQTGHPELLQVYYRESIEADRVRIYERLLHRDNHHHRLKGEWFDLTVEQGIGYVQFTLIEYDLVPVAKLLEQLSSRRRKHVVTEDY
jgi:hypothetical protein